MQKVSQWNSTIGHAEATIDYELKKAEFGEIKKATTLNRLTASLIDWLKYITIIFFFFFLFSSITIVILSFIFGINLVWLFGFLVRIELITYFILLIGLTLFSLDKDVDKKIKTWFAEMSTFGIKTTKIKLINFKTNMLIIPFENVMLKYNATGDVSRQLKKILVREDNIEKLLFRQADTIIEQDSKDKEKIDRWFAYFNFKNIPKDGHLEVEFI